ncbi:hypothetical protein [Microbulbifer rhizosphaerae]|uniref:Lipocalin-like domain-containing protein n=1 Tax=Microbulbifer rhizosphaerae TaxID=1562603 RepID=A0A7W4W7X6_9GAMM|nr:hypothetical protein [Microbulbifer rhizosphaerae]MBB3059296.1 hypothetical protein [Microbulbifer rhizosphaerae]
MKNRLAILVAGLLATVQVQAAELDKELVGDWLSLCKKASGNYLQVTSSFTADGDYTAKTVFYTDAECKRTMGMEVISSGKYRLGESVSAEGGESARQIDIDVHELRSGDMQLPGGKQKILQIITIIDGKLIFGDAPGIQAVTKGERPQKLNHTFYSRKQ